MYQYTAAGHRLMRMLEKVASRIFTQMPMPCNCSCTCLHKHQSSIPTESSSATDAVVTEMVQDSRVETYLQSQEEEGTDMLAGIQAWAHNASASLQRIVHQAVPARQQHHTLAEDEGVSTADGFQLQSVVPIASRFMALYWQGFYALPIHASAYIAAAMFCLYFQSATRYNCTCACHNSVVKSAGSGTATAPDAASEPAVMVSSSSRLGGCQPDACSSTCVEHCQAAKCRHPHSAHTVRSCFLTLLVDSDCVQSSSASKHKVNQNDHNCSCNSHVTSCLL